MQFGIKSLLGAMVLLAAFVMGVFQFSEEVYQLTIVLAHLLCPAIWVGAWCGSQCRGLKTFFLCGIVTGITPWFFTLLAMLEVDLSTSLAIVHTMPIADSTEQRFEGLLKWSSSGVIAIVGGLLGYWVQACCRPVGTAVPSISQATTDTTDPLAPETLRDG